MLNLKNIFLLSALLSLSHSPLANAQDGEPNPYASNDPAPKWASNVLTGTLTCRETDSFGVEWQDDHYVGVNFPIKSYTISKLTAAQASENTAFCRSEKRGGGRLMDEDVYLFSACYRFTGAINALGAAQGWCTEMHRKNKETVITCDFNQPVLSFSPSGEFTAYGRRFNMVSSKEPFLPVSFTSHGTCSALTDTPPKPLFNFK